MIGCCDWSSDSGAAGASAVTSPVEDEKCRPRGARRVDCRENYSEATLKISVGVRGMEDEFLFASNAIVNTRCGNSDHGR